MSDTPEIVKALVVVMFVAAGLAGFVSVLAGAL